MKYQFDFTKIDLDKNPECKDIKLVVHIAKKFWRVWHKDIPGLEFGDLIQSGYVGLTHAHKIYFKKFGRYNLDKKQYSNYIAKSIRHSIHETIAKNHTLIKINVPAYFLANKIENGIEISDPHQLKMARQALKARKMVSRRIDESLKLTAAGVDQKFINLDYINNSLRKLPKDQQLVLRLYYGLNNGVPLTFEQIGENHLAKKVTRQMAHIIHNRGIYKMQELIEW